MLYPEQLAQKIQTLPPPLLPMVDLFVDFLLTQYSTKSTEENGLNALEMTKIAMLGGAFDWLNEPLEEGIYSDEDGELI